MKNKYIQKDDFDQLPVMEQNDIISQNLKIYQKLRNEKNTKAFIKSQGKKQLLLRYDWFSPKEEIILDRFYLSKNQKTSKLENILNSLKREYFILVDNEREVFTGIDKLPIVVTGSPFFTYLNIINHPKSINIQVNWKVGGYSDKDYLGVDSREEIQYQSQIRRQFGLHGSVLDFRTGSILTDQSRI